MTDEQYQKKIAYRLIAAFKREFEDKTDLKVKISINRDKGAPYVEVIDETTLYLSLTDLEEDFKKCIPERLEYKQKDIIRCKSRARNIVDLRSIFADIAYKLNFTVTAIGRHMGKDHTTILHLKKKAAALLQTDPHYAALYSDIAKKLKIEYV